MKRKKKILTIIVLADYNPDIHTPGYRVQHSELGSIAARETDATGYRAGK